MSRETREERREAKNAMKREESAWRAIRALVIGAVAFIAVPMLLIHYGIPLLPDTVSTDGLEAILNRWIIAGMPIVVLSVLAGYFGLGSFARLGCCFTLMVLRIFWLLYLINFGDLSGLVTVTSGDTWISVDVAVTGIMVLTVVFELLRFLVDAGDHVDNRKAYLAEHGEGEDELRIVRINGRYD